MKVAPLTFVLLSACVHPRKDIVVPEVHWLAIPVVSVEKESYDTVYGVDADRLGCKGTAENLPICRIGLPNGQEDSAFREEIVRLTVHPDPHCRALSAAMARTLPYVRMYPRALVTEVGSVRYYGVGHSYRNEQLWQIRIARSLSELNPRSMDQKVRTFRHEVAHSIGASEERLLSWSAEEYADRCA